MSEEALCTALLNICGCHNSEYVVCDLEDQHEHKDHVAVGSMELYGELPYKYTFIWQGDIGQKLVVRARERAISLAREQQAGENANG